MTKPIVIKEVAQYVREAPLPVAVDFWAPWCPPCHTIAQHLEALADEYEGRMIVAKLNVDEHPGLQAQFGVFGLPTIIIFKDGQEAGRVIGAQPPSRLQRAFDAALDS